MGSDEPSSYELGKTLGKIEGHLESIDKRLEDGAVEMEGLSKEQKKITKCNFTMKNEISNNRVMIRNQATVINQNKAVSGDMVCHIDNDEIHFDKKKASQTSLGYLAKKRLLAILIVAIATIVSAVTGVVIAWINSGGQ